MFCCSNEDMLISIADAADNVTAEYGKDTTLSVLQKFGVNCVEDLNPSDYEAAFSDLYLMANDN